MESDEKYRRAKRRVAAIKGFYIHLIAYIAVITLLFFIDFLTPGGWWFYWALLGWGIGIIAHALTIFGITGLFGSDWEEKKIAELMNKTNKE
ncbi:2TM domain-containing protein [Limnofasciculus baicalensis]|uniref:2TM domain-containing protein n=1 Tax=Limnofasciculus baicalensis BBK-W-15 TaxID=2699891 RepID=A0AAE3KQR0_9CYAN|nr:2TM domain-containing protein [Limnofasciculus baicalensis]MCP2727637.1 2TM domain-containing protein [Limnofasciculus baicalensis BBK-W-15]